MQLLNRCIVITGIACMILLIASCSTYKDRVAPVPLPSLQLNHIEVDDVLISADGYVDEDAAKAALGFDARGAGLLPVRFVIDNQSQHSVKVNPERNYSAKII